MWRLIEESDSARQFTLALGDQAQGWRPTPALKQVAYPTRPRDKVFLAFYPPRETAGQLGRLAWYLRDKEGLRGKPLSVDRYHVTQLYLCEYAQLTRTDVAAIDEAVTSIGMSPFLVVFDLAERFRGRRGPIVLVGGEGVEGLKMFHYELVDALRQVGLTYRSDPHYTPHISLLYDERPFRTQAVEEIRWTARECVLVRSPQGEGRHIPLARWPLGGGENP
jgi:RNA 2',3'-cyclic 3'-phosphodiesterase